MDKRSPEYARQCLVRHVLRLRADPRYAQAQPAVDGETETAREWLDRWERKRKNTALREAVLEQWARGNKGQPGDWRETTKEVA